MELSQSTSIEHRQPQRPTQGWPHRAPRRLLCLFQTTWGRRRSNPEQDEFPRRPTAVDPHAASL